MASMTIKIEIKLRKMPLENPDNVSIRLYPYENERLAFHLLITDANSPTPNAKQSKNMWIAKKRIEDEMTGVDPRLAWSSRWPFQVFLCRWVVQKMVPYSPR